MPNLNAAGDEKQIENVQQNGTVGPSSLSPPRQNSIKIAYILNLKPETAREEPGNEGTGTLGSVFRLTFDPTV